MKDKILAEIELETNFINSYLKQFKQHLKGNKVLEINCKKGIHSKKISNMGLDLTAIDSNKELIEECLSKYKDIKFISRDFSKPLNDIGTFSGIVIANPISELSENELQQLFDNMHLILEDEGIIFIVNNIKFYSKETIDYLVKNKYVIIEEFIGDANWNFLLYKKNTVK